MIIGVSPAIKLLEVSSYPQLEQVEGNPQAHACFPKLKKAFETG
jgi:hypothetical protein